MNNSWRKEHAFRTATKEQREATLAYYKGRVDAHRPGEPDFDEQKHAYTVERLAHITAIHEELVEAGR